MQQPGQVNNHVTIPKARYIELLEMEIKLLKMENFQPTPAKIRGTNCNLSDVTKAIQATGISVRTWALNHGFSYDMVRKVACRFVRHRAIEAALTDEGFMEA